MKMALLVMFMFAAAIGYATFIENDYGTQSAKALIYSARWFEIILFLFTLILSFNIFKFKMYKRQKWGQLVLHVGFILIALGSLITRYVGYEGILHLRDKQESSTMVSDYMALSLHIDDGDKSYVYDKKVLLSSLGSNSIKQKIKVKNKEISIELLKYLPTAKESLEKVEKGGSNYIELMVSDIKDSAKTVYIKEGEVYSTGSIIINFNSTKNLDENTIYIKKEGDSYSLESTKDILTKSMDTLEEKTLKAGKNSFSKRVLYVFNGTNVVLKSSYNSHKLTHVSTELKSGGKYPQMLELKVTSANESKIVNLFGRDSVVGDIKKIKINGLDIGLQYGAKIINLPFKVRLDKFELERYPGSMSPSSYSSYVTVIDDKDNNKFSYHIFMNHVLDYKGYRFFQASYDMDEKGSILSVNHDPGTLPTYIGYLMLTIGFFWGFLLDKGRVKVLLRKLKKLEQKSVAAAVFAMFIASTLPMQAASIDASTLSKKELSKIKSISKEHTQKFAKLIVQESSGRMEPLDTLALEVVKKISSKRGFLGLDYNQIFLGTIVEPQVYNKLRFIKIAHPLVNKKIGLKKGLNYASFNDFFTGEGKGEYKLTNDLNSARAKRAAQRSKYDNEIIKIDERLNVLYMAEQGYLLKLFPKPNDPNNTWYNPIDAMKAFPQKEGMTVKYIVSSYLQSAVEGVDSGNWTKADKALDVIAKFQNFYGSKLIPSEQKVLTEINYNHINIFSWLILPYILIGFALLVMAFIAIVKPTINIKAITKFAGFLLILTLIVHTIGLIIRWYIAEHAPWSNAYESILYIAWATALAGFIFAKRSPLSFAATSILAGIFIFVAFISNMNPQITNLVPVLKSYWLMIHVAVITASYGFLGLGALLGMFVLVLFIINRNKEDGNIVNAIKELTIINEITLLIGLALVTIGNFLGGVWANESWGRYWGWDAKETWAAVTILVYAIVVHMRFVKRFNSIYAFNVAAILAYFSVIMTYFGVNYYLSGMHSYAAGDPVPIPTWVYFAVASVFALIAVASRYKVKGKL
jgi:cytochrome c-type biogenesis protein CcsB